MNSKTYKILLAVAAISCLTVLAAGLSVLGGRTVQEESVSSPAASNDENRNRAPATTDQNPTLLEVKRHSEAAETAAALSIGKAGPAMAFPGELITYTLSITNDGDSAATDVVITDVLPSGAHYIGGGTLMLAGTVGWTVASLAPSDSVRVQFAVTATRTITNSDYRVSCSEGISATGIKAIVTDTGYRAYQPSVLGSYTPTHGYTHTTLVYTYTIANVYPHDPDAFTQGLVFEDGVLYEGTGLWGYSTLRKVALETGEVLQSYALPSDFFGEGITIYGEKIIQLTWRSHVGFVYDSSSFELLQEFNYPTEGWGITHDGEHLIMSDGTPTLHFWDPATFEETGRVTVYDENGPVTRLNELEYIQGEVYANVWQTDRIARIDPQTGWVVGWIDLKGLLSPGSLSQPVDVLNGIAYDPETDRLFVTGKLWPNLFEIELTVAR